MKPAHATRFGTAHQTSWDWRAAGNFIGGGTGSALLAFAVFTAQPAAPQPWLLALALAFIGAGLACVWTEIGRPWRAMNVLFHPQTSWMTREAFVAGLIVALVAAAALTGITALHLAAGAAGLVFLYCQGRILKAARGIPAWREPAVVPLIVATGLTEGLAVLVLATLAAGGAHAAPLAALAGLVVLRLATWLHYRQRLSGPGLAPATGRALVPAHRGLIAAGTVLPLAAAALAIALPQGAGLAAALAAVAALGAGWHFKLVLVTRAAQAQGYALGNKLRRGHPLAQPDAPRRGNAPRTPDRTSAHSGFPAPTAVPTMKTQPTGRPQ